MIDSIIKEANISGAKDMHLPYPTGDQEPPSSKLDNASIPEERTLCSKYPYRRVVGQLMYGMVHTMIGILYALNVLLVPDILSFPNTYCNTASMQEVID